MLTFSFQAAEPPKDLDPDVQVIEESNDIADIEEIGGASSGKRAHTTPPAPTVTKKRKVDKHVENTEFVESDLLKSWKEVLGNPPSMGTTKVFLRTPTPVFMHTFYKKSVLWLRVKYS